MVYLEKDSDEDSIDAVREGKSYIIRPNPAFIGITRSALLFLFIFFGFIIQKATLGRYLDAGATSSTPISSSALPSFGFASSNLQWVGCGGTRFECANLSVPLDYLNKDDNRTASIAITRYLASNRSADTGTIIFNPGGPGGSGTGRTYRLGPQLDYVLQGQYDILGFDPRGINMTLPKVTCLKSDHVSFALGQTLENTNPSLNIHDVGIWDSVLQILAEECENHSGAGVLPFVNTPTVARDIASIADALQSETKHLSYWGFSYGTNLGAIFTAMFPNKLRHIILDGIRSPLDAREIYEWGYTSLASQNDVFDGYFEICDEVGKERCAIAASGDSKNAVLDLMSKLKERPLPVISNGIIGLVTYYNYKHILYGVLYHPKDWPLFATATAELLNGNGTIFLQNFTSSYYGGSQSYSFSEGPDTAVLCTDAAPATNYTLDSWKAFVQNMTELSFIAGDSRSLDILACRHWHALPNERWTGDFKNIDLEVPILMIGNSFDPATPIASARRLAKELGENAFLLEQRSYGHCSTSSNSTCTFDVVRDYLLNGKLPEVAGKVCEVDDLDYEGYFPSQGKEGMKVMDEMHQAWMSIMNEVNFARKGV